METSGCQRVATRLLTASRRKGSAQPCGTGRPSSRRAGPLGGPTHSRPQSSLLGVPYDAPVPGDASGQGYRGNPGHLHPWATIASPQTVPRSGRMILNFRSFDGVTHVAESRTAADEDIRLQSADASNSYTLQALESGHGMPRMRPADAPWRRASSSSSWASRRCELSRASRFSVAALTRCVTARSIFLTERRDCRRARRALGPWVRMAFRDRLRARSSTCRLSTSGSRSSTFCSWRTTR